MAAEDKITDPDLHHIATAQLAVDGEIEQRSIPQAAMLIKEEANSPNLSRLERALRSDLAREIPRPVLTDHWIKF
jgi:hypothetical protein